MAGATRYDKLCHSVFGGKGNGRDFLARDTHIHCGSCGRYLSTYYCEEGLFLVVCERCEKRALVKAKNPRDAAYKTFAHEIIKIDEMGEENAVFFGTMPIKEAGKDHSGCKCRACWVDDMRGEVIDAPAADVAPVRHGRWLCVDTDTEQFFLCNRCKKKEYWESNYCPNCGCFMR